MAKNMQGLADYAPDFSKKKKKRKIATDIKKLLVIPDGNDDEEKMKEIDPKNKIFYDFDYLIDKAYDMMKQINPGLFDDNKKVFTTKPPMLARVGTKKTAFVNFDEIVRSLKRPQQHLTSYLLAELGTLGSIDANGQLLIKGRFLQKQVESIVRKYIKEYVLCHTCKAPDTELVKETRLMFLKCNVCNSKCSVTNIKTGFQAVTGKRKAQRQ